MSTQALLLPPVAPAQPAGRPARIEYLDFRDVEGHREYRFRVYGRDGSGEFRMRVSREAFDARRVRIQDGPDLCYQKLLRAIVAGLTPSTDVMTIEDAEFVAYREEHTVVPKRRPRRPADPSTVVEAPAKPQRFQLRTPRRTAPQPPPPAIVEIEPAFREGQRVSHSVFGMGVTTATTSERTVVSFDRDGSRSFVTSMVELEVLSGPHAWKTSARGVNRPCTDQPDEDRQPV
jgi:hypothetical protein